MGIKHSHVSLVCNYGSDELSVSKDDDGEIMFRLGAYGETQSCYVRPEEARQFAETILKVIDG